MRSRDMTEGNIWRLIIPFAIPLLLGNMLQQLYNAFDAIVVGNYVGKEALGAVGSSGTLINMIIAFFMGMSTGASILISQSFGAKDYRTLHDVVHTAFCLSVVMGAALSLVGIVLSPWLLEMIMTPQSILPQAVEYLRIFFIGMTALTVYNMGTAILTAVGDSRRPLYFLMVSAVLNIVLDLVFVLWLGMDVDGVAWATVIAEAVSAILVVLSLCRVESFYKLNLRELRVEWGIVRRVTVIGLPAGIQQAVISLSNLVVQSYINRFGPDVVSGYSAYVKLDAFVMLPVQTMALAVTAFVGQNLGAKQVKRAGLGVRYVMGMALAITVSLSLLLMLAGPFFLRIFTSDPSVLEAGYNFVRVFAPASFALCFTQVLPGALRGAGDVRTPTLICIVCFVVLRQIYLYVISGRYFTVTAVALSYPITWAIAAVVLALYYKRRDWSGFEAPVGGAENI